ncbi:MAG: DUF4360 domain-containing protein, partial [Bdellovibrionota bacterium]
GPIAAGGDGCPTGTSVQYEQTGNEVTVRVRPADFDLDLNSGESGSALVRKGCALAIPVAHLSENSQVHMTSISFQGKYDIRASASAKIRIESFTNSDGPEQSRVVEIPLTDGTQDVSGDLKVVATDLTKTCNTDSQVLRLNSSAMIRAVEGTTQSGRSRMEVSEIVLTLRAEPCQK